MALTLSLWAYTTVLYSHPQPCPRPGPDPRPRRSWKVWPGDLRTSAELGTQPARKSICSLASRPTGLEAVRAGASEGSSALCGRSGGGRNSAKGVIPGGNGSAVRLGGLGSQAAPDPYRDEP